VPAPAADNLTHRPHPPTEQRLSIKELENKLAELNEKGVKDGGKPVRIWMDGAFDVMHYGHMNAFRQVPISTTIIIHVIRLVNWLVQAAIIWLNLPTHLPPFRQGKMLGTWLVVGVNTDESITVAKVPLYTYLPPILNYNYS
jgi:bifunctional ADP-heptose synthase (sugar kinase/adenylyltransferase)